MRERIEAYEELKYTAINCGIDTEDIPFLIDYISANFEEKSRLRNQILQKNSRKWAILVMLQLSRMNSKALEVLENNVARFVGKKEEEMREAYYSFIHSLNTDTISKKLLFDFLEHTDKKLLLIPLYPKIESLSCIALDHSESVTKCWFSERVSRIIWLFMEHPQVYAATQWKFILKEDTPLIRSQVEQDVSRTTH